MGFYRPTDEEIQRLIQLLDDNPMTMVDICDWLGLGKTQAEGVLHYARRFLGQQGSKAIVCQRQFAGPGLFSLSDKGSDIRAQHRTGMGDLHTRLGTEVATLRAYVRSTEPGSAEGKMARLMLHKAESLKADVAFVVAEESM